MDSQVSKLQAELAVAQREERKARIKQAEERYTVVVLDTRKARDEALRLIRKFKEESYAAALVETLYLAVQTEIANLDDSRDDYPTREETATYEADRARLVADMEAKRTAYREAKNALEVLRIQVVRADAAYVAQARIAQNFRNEIDRAKEDEAAATRFEKLTMTFGSSVQIAR